MASLCKIETDAHSYYLCHSPNDDDHGFDLTLTNCTDAWCGSVSSEELQHMAKKLRVKYDEFATDTKKALTRKNVGSLNFEYGVKLAKSGDATFTWKKYVPSENIRIQLGNTSLSREEDPAEVIRSVFDLIIESDSQVSETINSLKSDNERLAAERVGALKRLEKAVSVKEELEKDLYNKFVIILNHKKDKIRELTQEIEELQSGRPKPSTSHRNSTAVKQEVKNSSDSEMETNRKSNDEESDYHTDDELDVKPSTSHDAPLFSQCKRPGRAKADTSGEGDLAFDGAEEMSPVVATASRRRRGKQLKQTPSKPVIPRVPSSDSKNTPPSSSRTPLRRKSSSKKSTGSDPDFDDLLNAGFD